MEERPFMVRWVVGSISHGGPIELLCNSVTKDMLLSSLCDIAYKNSLLLIGKSPYRGGDGCFLIIYVVHDPVSGAL